MAAANFDAASRAEDATVELKIELGYNWDSTPLGKWRNGGKVGFSGKKSDSLRNNVG
jgi:hypothetical protein